MSFKITYPIENKKKTRTLKAGVEEIRPDTMRNKTSKAEYLVEVLKFIVKPAL